MLSKNNWHIQERVNGARHIVECMTENILFLPATAESNEENRLSFTGFPREPGADNFSAARFR